MRPLRNSSNGAHYKAHFPAWLQWQPLLFQKNYTSTTSEVVTSLPQVHYLKAPKATTSRSCHIPSIQIWGKVLRAYQFKDLWKPARKWPSQNQQFPHWSMLVKEEHHPKPPQSNYLLLSLSGSLSDSPFALPKKGVEGQLFAATAWICGPLSQRLNLSGKSSRNGLPLLSSCARTLRAQLTKDF